MLLYLIPVGLEIIRNANWSDLYAKNPKSLNSFWFCRKLNTSNRCPIFVVSSIHLGIYKISKAWFEFTLNLLQCMLVVCYKSIASDSERYTKELHFEKWLIRLPSFFNSRFNMVKTLAEFIELKMYDYTITAVITPAGRWLISQFQLILKPSPVSHSTHINDPSRMA